MKRPNMDPDFRAAVMTRDRYSCQARAVGFSRYPCAGPLHAHHRVGVTKVDELPNVVTVCGNCHEYLHRHPALAHCYGLIIPRWWMGDLDEVIPELERRLKEFRVWFNKPPRAPWVTDDDLQAAAEFDLRWADAIFW